METNYKKLAINQVINFFWTAFSFAPVIYYWYLVNSPIWFYSFIGVSLLAGFLPETLFNHLQLSGNPKFYERLGVKKARMFVQNGDWTKKAASAGFQSKKARINKTRSRNYLKTIAMYERYHFLCFVFFTLSALHALITGAPITALIIAACNIIYNAYPILLQQYNKAKILKISGFYGNR